MDMMTKAVLFDFGQTLVDSADGFRRAEKEAKSSIYARFEATGREPTRDLFLQAYRKLRKEFHQKSNFSRLALWQSVYKKFNRESDISYLQKCEKRYWNQVKAMTRPFPETIAVLEQLADRFDLALITNTQGQKNRGKHRIALFPELERFFKVILIAGESGIPPKPAPEPFRRCLEKMDVLPREAVFVGDDWRIDICGAQNAGIPAVWLQHHRVQRNWPVIDAPFEPVITDLNELLTLSFDNIGS